MPNFAQKPEILARVRKVNTGTVSELSRAPDDRLAISPSPPHRMSVVSQMNVDLVFAALTLGLVQNGA